MYITPNSNIILLKGVPLDNSYNDTIYFASAAAQLAWFEAIPAARKQTFSNYTYQRVGSDAIKVGVSPDTIYSYNYMMFKNTAYGNKWFYAFITSIDYVNDNTALVHYEIDVIQTWFFDVTLDPCYVEREHSDTDNIGDNVLPEPLNITEYTESIERPKYSDWFTSYDLLIWSAESLNV